MHIYKSMLVNWDEQTSSNIRQYRVDDCGFTLEGKGSTTFNGRRGSWLGTMMSPSLSHFKTDLRIRCDGSRLDCTMEIDTRFRSITLYQRQLLELEFATFESFLKSGDRQREAWDAYRREAIPNLRNTASGNLGHMLGRGKPDKPMQIGGDLILKTWTYLGFGVLTALFFLIWGDGIFRTLLMHVRGRPFAHHPGPPFLGGLMAVGMGALFTTLAAVMYQLWRNAQDCLNVERAAVKLGLDSEALHKVIEQRGIKAKFIMDGEPVYELGDITGAATLLRPVEHTEEATLLKPVSGMHGATESVLMRPVDTAEAEVNSAANRG
jgi:hypothetical protein